jgi:hypothetical protein
LAANDQAGNHLLIGLVVGAVALVVIVIGMILFCVLRRRFRYTDVYELEEEEKEAVALQPLENECRYVTQERFSSSDGDLMAEPVFEGAMGD